MSAEQPSNRSVEKGGSSDIPSPEKKRPLSMNERLEIIKRLEALSAEVEREWREQGYEVEEDEDDFLDEFAALTIVGIPVPPEKKE